MLLGARTMAQSGIRFQLYNMQWTFADVDQRSNVFALGYDHDMTPHLAFGVDAGYATLETRTGNNGFGGSSSARQYVLNYRSYYLTGRDNESTSFYVGSYLGVRRIVFDGPSRSITAVPLGFRLGIRGGLPGFFMDLYGEAGMQLGGALPKGAYENTGGSLSGPQFRIGADFGIGWD
ncbi:MAG: hypothetical protein QM724_04735 [Flavobacteriales bacterium]